MAVQVFECVRAGAKRDLLTNKFTFLPVIS